MALFARSGHGSWQAARIYRSMTQKRLQRGSKPTLQRPGSDT